jgi:hypothetical protein
MKLLTEHNTLVMELLGIDLGWGLRIRPLNI